jgi:hypothetical protein
MGHDQVKAAVNLVDMNKLYIQKANQHKPEIR